MTASLRRGGRRRRLLHVLSVERGALLWLPAIIGAALFLLWAMRVVPSDSARYTESRQFRVILGPVHAPAGEAGLARTVREALRHRLDGQRDVALVPEAAVRQRTQRLTSGDVVAEPLQCIRATRTLKARFYLTGEVRRVPQGGVTARIAVWETARERPVEELRLQDVSAGALGQRIADSLAVALFEPALQRNALR